MMSNQSESVLLERARVKTAGGSDLSFSSRGDGTLLVDGAAAMVGSDVGNSGGIRVSNGIIQVIDELPPSLR